MLVVVKQWAMGDNVKGLHNGPRVPLIYDRFSNARGDLSNELLVPSASMLEVTWSKGVRSRFL